MSACCLSGYLSASLQRFGFLRDGGLSWHGHAGLWRIGPFWTVRPPCRRYCWRVYADCGEEVMFWLWIGLAWLAVGSIVGIVFGTIVKRSE